MGGGINEEEESDEYEEAQGEELDLAARFHCGVCFDELPMRDGVHLDSCSHLFCAGCVRRWVLWREACHPRAPQILSPPTPTTTARRPPAE